MEIYVDRLTATFGAYLPRLLAAVAILVAGWLVALAVSALVRAALKRTTLDNRLANWLRSDREADPPRVEALAGRIVFWVLMAITIVAFLQVIGLAFVAGPVDTFLREIFAYLPNLLSAVLLLLLAWLLARVLRFLVTKAAETADLDRRLARQAEPPEGAPPAAEGYGGEVAEPGGDPYAEGHAEPPPAPDAVPATAARAPRLSRTLGETVYWLTFLLFLPAILDTLELDGLLEPVNDLVQEVLGYLPNLLGAALILVVGWLVARVVQRLVANLLAAAGLDRLGDRIGVSRAAGGRSLSSVVGLVLYILILIPVIIAALDTLAIEAVTRPASQMLDRILLTIPSLFAALVILVISWYVGRVLAGLVANLLSSIGFDRFLERIGLAGRGPAPAPETAAAPAPGSAAPRRRKPSEIVGFVVLVAVMLFAAIEALAVLGFDLLAAMVTQFTLFGGNVLLGALIFVFGYYLAGLAAGLVRSSEVANSNTLATVTQGAIIVLAAVMALRQAGLAEDVILLAFGLTLGAIAIAAAVAFGIGGREQARHYIERWTGGEGEPPPGR